MEKKYERYFGKNIARIIYLISVAFLAVGVASAIGYNAYYGGIFCTVGGILFILTSARQISDRQIDELVQKTENEYKDKVIKGKIADKKEINPEDFSMFSGFIRDSGDVRFKAGSDTKIRTSRYFVTAISVKKDDCKIFTTVYDMLSDKTPQDRMIFTKGAESVYLEKESVEFPRGIFKCTVKAEKDGGNEELMFYLPDDALAEELLRKIAGK